MADAAKRAAKRQRLGELRATLPFISQEALSAISQRPDLPACSRKDIRKSRDDETKINTPYGTLHTTIEVPQLESDSPLQVEIQNPFAILWFSVTLSVAFSGLIANALQRCPCTFANPWHVIMYNDEISPGNQLAFKNARKLQGIYWSILELGIAALCNEECWFEVCFLRSVLTKTINGGIRMLIGAIITFMFLGSHGHNFTTSGVCITLACGRVVTLFLKYAITLADEAALHAIYESKGATGLKCCLLCLNCFDGKNARHIVESPDLGGAVLHTCSEFRKLVLLTPALLDAILARLVAAHGALGQDLICVYVLLYDAVL